MDIPGKAWPKDFPDVTTLAGYKEMKNHPDYEAAKTGDTDAAVRLIHSLMTEGANARIMEMAAKHPDAVLLGIHAIESGGKNEIPQALADYISELTGLETEQDILQSNIVSHTGAGQNERLYNRAKFEGEVEPGRDYIVADDMVTMGSTFGALRHFIESKGGRVADMISLSTQHDNNKKVALGDETKLDLEKTFGIRLPDGGYDMTPLNDFLRESGMYGGNYESLVESEARAILHAKGLDEARNRRTQARQKIGSRTQPKTVQGTGSQENNIAEDKGTAPGDEGGSAFDGWADFNAEMDALDAEDEAVRAARESPSSRKNPIVSPGLGISDDARRVCLVHGGNRPLGDIRVFAEPRRGDPRENVLHAFRRLAGAFVKFYGLFHAGGLFRRERLLRVAHPQPLGDPDLVLETDRPLADISVEIALVELVENLADSRLTVFIEDNGRVDRFEKFS